MNRCDLKTWLAAAEWSLRNGRIDEAMERADNALEIDPNSYRAMLLRGTTTRKSMDHETAARYYKAASELVYYETARALLAKDPAAALNRALALYEEDDKGKRRLALTIARANFHRDPSSREARRTYQYVFDKCRLIQERERDEIDESKWLRRAEELLETVREGANVKPDRAYYVALFLADHGRKEDAKELLRAALKSKLFFAERSQAEALLKKLKK